MKTTKHIFSLLIGILLIASGSAFAFSGYGGGTETDPYVITDVYQLQEMKDDMAAHYVLGNDIDASSTKYWNDGQGFEPIGALIDGEHISFTGSLDGRGYSISKFYINRINASQQALFGVLSTATVKNVTLNDADVTGDRNAATLAGQVFNESCIIFCAATGKITLKPGTGDSKSGGLIGSAVTGSTVDICFSDVIVNADHRKQVGGLIGYLRGRDYTPVTKLTNSFSYGTVTGSGHKVGNLVGDADNSHVEKCYSNGKDQALIGYNFGSPKITNCYWDNEIGASSSSFGGTPKTSEQMTSRETFENWDFDETWSIDEGRSYPYLKRWAN